MNNVQVVNNWTDHSPTVDTSAGINLVAGQRVDVRMEFYERGGGAVARLRWQIPGDTSFVAVPASRLFVPAVGGVLTGRYFNNTSMSGTPVLTRIEAIDFGWGTGSPGTGVNQNNFSVRWVGTRSFATTRSYAFTATADDGVRVFLDGTQIINQWRDQSPTTYTVNRQVTAGNHQVRMDYYENGGGAVARLTIT